MDSGGVSGTEVERLGDLTGLLDGVLSRLHELDVSAATGPELLAAMPDLIRAGRRLGAVEAKVLDAVDRRRVYAPDGDLSAMVMVRHVGQLPGFEAHRRWQTVRMLRDLPKVAAAYEADERLGRSDDLGVVDGAIGVEPRFVPFAQLGQEVEALPRETDEGCRVKPWR